MSGFLGMLFSGGGGGSGPPPVGPSEYISFAGPATANRWKVYNWNTGTGLGTSFVSPTVNDIIRQVSFVSDNSNISIGTSNNPWISVWQWSSLGFGTQYANPATLLTPNSNGPAGYAWTTSADAVLTANYDQPQSYPQAWRWTASAGFGTKYSNGTNFGYAQGVSINGDSTLVAFNGSASPGFVHLYPWSLATGFGTKYATATFSPNPLSIGWQELSFNKVTNDLALGRTASPYVFACSVSSAGFGTQYSSPPTPLATGTNGLLFSPDGSAIGTVNSGSPSLNAYQWGAGFGTKYSNPVSLTFSSQQSMDWASTTNAIVGTSNSTAPYANIYGWSSAGFGSKYTVPAGVPTNAARVSFSNKSR
jgi:hypothetical protein